MAYIVMACWSACFGTTIPPGEILMVYVVMAYIVMACWRGKRTSADATGNYKQKTFMIKSATNV